MSWWHKLPSLTPVKGLVRFLYVWTNWETISEELKSRDDRLQAVEEWGRQILRLEREVQEAERLKLERGLNQDAADLSQNLVEATLALAIMLYTEEAPVRDHVLQLVQPKLRGILNDTLERFSRLEAGRGPRK